MVNNERKDKAKDFPIIELALSLGIEVERDKKALCFNGHDRATKSLSFDIRTNRFKCFGCGESGDTICLVQKITKCTFGEAINRILGGEIGPCSPRQYQPQIRPANASGEDFSDVYDFFLKLLPFPDLKHYLVKERCLSLEVLSENNIKAIDPEKSWNYRDALLKAFPEEKLLKSGILASNKKRNGSHFFFYECCTIFPFYKGQKIVYLQGRVRPDREDLGKARNLSRINKPSFYIPKLSCKGTIYLVEGIVSALYVKKNGNDSIALLSGTSVTDAAIQELLPYKSQLFVQVPDVDLVGKTSFDKLADLLFKNGFHYEPEKISAKEMGRRRGASEEELKGVKDINDLRHILKKEKL